MNYERLIQWVAGPLAAGIAYLATTLVHTNISHSAALNVATFVATAIVIYAGHHKWLDNLPKWWQESGIAAPAGLLDDNAVNSIDTAQDGPDRSNIPTTNGPLLDERTNTSTEGAEKSDDDDSYHITSNIIPTTGTGSGNIAVTGVTDATDQEGAAEQLRAQLRAAGIEPGA